MDLKPPWQELVNDQLPAWVSRHLMVWTKHGVSAAIKKGAGKPENPLSAWSNDVLALPSRLGEKNGAWRWFGPMTSLTGCEKRGAMPDTSSIFVCLGGKMTAYRLIWNRFATKAGGHAPTTDRRESSAAGSKLKKRVYQSMPVTEEHFPVAWN